MSMKDDTDFEVYGFIKNKIIYNLRELFLKLSALTILYEVSINLPPRILSNI